MLSKIKKSKKNVNCARFKPVECVFLWLTSEIFYLQRTSNIHVP